MSDTMKEINDRFAAARTAILARLKQAGVADAEALQLVTTFESAALGWLTSKQGKEEKT